MANNLVRVEVFGVAEALRELKDLEKTVYNRLTRDLRTSAQPLARAVGAEFPDEPLMNWGGDGERTKTSQGKRGFPTYNTARARAGVKPAVSTTLRRRATDVSILRIQQMDPAGQIYDSAGSVTRAGKDSVGGMFIQNLDKNLNTKSVQGEYRSRVLYPATKKHLPKLLPAITESVERTIKQIEERINR
jgi:hypothetical protein